MTKPPLPVLSTEGYSEYHMSASIIVSGTYSDLGCDYWVLEESFLQIPIPSAIGWLKYPPSCSLKNIYSNTGDRG